MPVHLDISLPLIRRLDNPAFRGAISSTGVSCVRTIVR